MQETNAAAAPVPEVETPEANLAESLAAFQKLTKAKERKAFYEAHPELARVYNPTNFHAV